LDTIPVATIAAEKAVLNKLTDLSSATKPTPVARDG
jgi:hypothetical protein